RFALRNGANAICEKPLVLNPWNVEALMELEKESGHSINNILQLRLHPVIINLREKILSANSAKKHKVSLDYITSRGAWYDVSWKGDESKSGGIATNIGIHFFDMLIWVFGKVQTLEVSHYAAHKASGTIELEHAFVEWNLSIDADDLPKQARNEGKRTFRCIVVDGEELEFSEGFGDLHTLSYRKILEGNGFPCSEVLPSIQLVHDIRNRRFKK
ncbi:MAG: Gfo/Idh/MocA family oxidoreductase, partial [Cytophagales bacterium]